VTNRTPGAERPRRRRCAGLRRGVARAAGVAAMPILILITQHVVPLDGAPMRTTYEHDVDTARLMCTLDS
jgi:hypothetical protein